MRNVTKIGIVLVLIMITGCTTYVTQEAQYDKDTGEFSIKIQEEEYEGGTNVEPTFHIEGYEQRCDSGDVLVKQRRIYWPEEKIYRFNFKSDRVDYVKIVREYDDDVLSVSTRYGEGIEPC
jgi:hypothetical protein